jgi:hypothetical protein
MDSWFHQGELWRGEVDEKMMKMNQLVQSVEGSGKVISNNMLEFVTRNDLDLYKERLGSSIKSDVEISMRSLEKQFLTQQMSKLSNPLSVVDDKSEHIEMKDDNIMKGIEDRLYEKMIENIKVCVKESIENAKLDVNDCLKVTNDQELNKSETFSIDDSLRYICICMYV